MMHTMLYLPGSGVFSMGGGDSEPESFALMGLLLIAVMLLVTIFRRRKVLGVLQVFLMLCMVSMPLLRTGDEFGWAYYLTYLVVMIAGGAFWISLRIDA